MISVYPNDVGTISVTRLGADQVGDALRTTPFGVPFLILEDDAVLTDRTFRNAWEADFSEPHGVGLGPHRWFIQQAEAEIVEIASRVAPIEPEATVAAPFDEVAFPDDLTPEERQARYFAYVADVEAHNTAGAKRHAKAMAAFQSQQQSDTNRCNALIEQMKAEVFAIEGVIL